MPHLRPNAFRLGLLALCLALVALAGCATRSAWHYIYYQNSDNPNVELLGWEYNGYKRLEPQGSPPEAIGRIHVDAPTLADQLKLRWRVKPDGPIQVTSIDFRGRRPADMVEAQIRILFNDRNQPEIYVFHKDTGRGSPFEFVYRGQRYIQKAILQVYPEVKPIERPAAETKKTR